MAAEKCVTLLLIVMVVSLHAHGHHMSVIAVIHVAMESQPVRAAAPSALTDVDEIMRSSLCSSFCSFLCLSSTHDLHGRIQCNDHLLFLVLFAKGIFYAKLCFHDLLVTQKI